MMQCLTNIIGITLSDCQCIIQGLTPEVLATLRPSTSGLYLDDLEGGVHLKVLTRADACKTMADMALTARSEAIKQLEADLTAGVAAKYKKERKPYNGQVGRTSFAQSLGITRPIQGLRLQPEIYGDGLITVKLVQLILNQAVTITVRLIRAIQGDEQGEEIGAWPVNTTANAYTTVNIGPEPLSLPFIHNEELVEYYFVYDVNEPGLPVQPKDNGLRCSTCEKNKEAYNGFISAKGVQLTSTSALNNKITDEFSHGFVLDVSIDCNTTALFCREYSDQEALAVVMAYCVRYKAGELLIEDVLRQPDINRYTTMDKERLWGKRNHFRKEYSDRLPFLIDTIDVASSNCYICREVKNKPFFTGIFS